ncbi:MAG TPA: hypothetical protein VGO69_07760, partial [Pyrinomonadaceae bacterium]|nr:hypothetical protein [Pyrinomonadaceae bacterium]
QIIFRISSGGSSSMTAAHCTSKSLDSRIHYRPSGFRRGHTRVLTLAPARGQCGLPQSHRALRT